MAHVQWALHGSGTLLQQLHHPREVFLTFSCDWVAIGLFHQKVPVDHFIDPNGPLWEAKKTHSANRLFCRYVTCHRRNKQHSEH